MSNLDQTKFNVVGIVSGAVFATRTTLTEAKKVYRKFEGTQIVPPTIKPEYSIWNYAPIRGKFVIANRRGNIMRKNFKGEQKPVMFNSIKKAEQYITEELGGEVYEKPC
jgi:hypothetical protein